MERELAELRADQIVVVGAIDLLEDLEAEIAVALACGVGQFMQGRLHARPIGSGNVHVRDDVEPCVRIELCVGLVEYAIQALIG